MIRYTRHDVLRILHLPSRQLVAWERAGLIESFAEAEPGYSFGHLRRLTKLREMRAQRVSNGQIRTSELAMEQVAGVGNAQIETGAVLLHGRRLAFRHAGALFDPMTQQMAFDFERMQGALKVVNARPGTEPVSAVAAQVHSRIQEMFLRGVRLEEKQATLAEAQTTYEELLELKPDHAPACINLGTILYNQREFARAEAMYRRATETDPEYALAFFDLGNVLDEMQRLEDAIDAYTRAIALLPAYADAHYNLALAFERKGERRRALRHWTAYARLDPEGPWSAHAKGQARKILSTERLSIVSRDGQLVAAG